MFSTGICPNCKQKLVNVEAENVDIKFDLNNIRRGLSYKCSSCKGVLGVQMNPYTLNDDLKTEILEEVKKMLH